MRLIFLFPRAKGTRKKRKSVFIMTIKKFIVGLLGFFVLFLWKNIYAAGCFTLLIPLVIGGIITFNVREAFLKKRKCIVDCYFTEKTFPYRLLNGKLFFTLIAFIISMILTLALVLNVIIWDIKYFIILGIDLFLLYGLYFLFLKFFGTVLKDSIKYTVIKNFSTHINTLIVLVVLVIIQFYSAVPNYIKPSLQETVQTASQTVASQCQMTNTFAKLNIEKEAFIWYIMIVNSQKIDNKNLKWLAWIIFLFSGGLSIVGYSRYILQILDIFNQKG